MKIDIKKIAATRKYQIIAAIVLAAIILISTIVAIVSCDADNGSNENNNVNNNNNNNTTDNGDEPETVKVDYTVKVVDGDGNGVAGVTVVMEVGPVDEYTLTTDENGNATQKMEETKLPIVAYIEKLPEGYGKGSTDEVKFASGAKSGTISVVKQIKYSAKFVDSEGNAISGIEVQVCVGEVCNTPVTTDANGEAYYYINPTEEAIKLQINKLTTLVPDGTDFEYSASTDSYYDYYEVDEYSKTVTLVTK